MCGCENCIAMQARCNDLADWLTSRGLLEVTDEDAKLLAFLVSKGVVLPMRDLQVMATDSLGGICSSAYFLGYKKGYEVKALDILTDGRKK